MYCTLPMGHPADAGDGRAPTSRKYFAVTVRVAASSRRNGGIQANIRMETLSRGQRLWAEAGLSDFQSPF